MKAAEKIRQAIEDGVRSGALLPGDPINEPELCSRYNVSRTPIREALLQLQAQGLVTSLPRAGMVIARMDVAQLLSMWELLAELEGVCARLACERMSPAECADLERRHRGAQSIAAANDLDAWKGANLAFHELLYTGSRNPYLRQEILRMRARTGAYRDHAFAALGNIRASWDQHAEVVVAVVRQDAVAAHGAMVRHLSPGQGTGGFAGFLATLPKELLD